MVEPGGDSCQRFRACAEVGCLGHDGDGGTARRSGVDHAGLPDEVPASLRAPAALEGDGAEAGGAETPALARLDVLHQPEDVARLRRREETAVRERPEERHGLARAPLGLPERGHRASGWGCGCDGRLAVPGRPENGVHVFARAAESALQPLEVAEEREHGFVVRFGNRGLRPRLLLRCQPFAAAGAEHRDEHRHLRGAPAVRSFVAAETFARPGAEGSHGELDVAGQAPGELLE